MAQNNGLIDIIVNTPDYVIYNIMFKYPTSSYLLIRLVM